MASISQRQADYSHIVPILTDLMLNDPNLMEQVGDQIYANYEEQIRQNPEAAFETFIDSDHAIYMPPPRLVRLFKSLEHLFPQLDNAHVTRLFLKLHALEDKREKWHLNFTIPLFLEMGKVTDDEIVLPRFILVPRGLMHHRDAVKRDGYYYTPEALAELDRMKRDRVPNEQDARRLFEAFKNFDFFPWKHTAYGCNPRAYTQNHFLYLMGYDKEHLSNSYSFVDPSIQKPKYPWVFHVTTTFGDDIAMDPATLSSPKAVNTWLRAQTTHNAPIRVLVPKEPTSLRFRVTDEKPVIKYQTPSHLSLSEITHYEPDPYFVEFEDSSLSAEKDVIALAKIRFKEEKTYMQGLLTELALATLENLVASISLQARSPDALLVLAEAAYTDEGFSSPESAEQPTHH